MCLEGTEGQCRYRQRQKKGDDRPEGTSFPTATTKET
jgi:hypothetical protein